MNVSTSFQQPIDVLCVRASEGVAGAREAFERLEAALPTLKGQRFYGALDSNGVYRACVARQKDDCRTYPKTLNSSRSTRRARSKRPLFLRLRALRALRALRGKSSMGGSGIGTNLAASLQAWTLPGGWYARTKIEDWPDRIPEIATAFQAMASEHTADPSRPSIEHYRSQRELILLLPIVS